MAKLTLIIEDSADGKDITINVKSVPPVPVDNKKMTLGPRIVVGFLQQLDDSGEIEVLECK